MSRKSNGNYLAILLIVIAISALTFGYAILSNSLNINGTAITSGNFNVEFSYVSVESKDGCNPVLNISSDKNRLNISIPDLSYPGSFAKIKVTVTNTGTIGAKLKGLDITGNTDTDINISYSNLDSGVEIDSLDQHTFYVDVVWNSKSTNVGKTLNFAVTLNYEQNT